MSHASSVSNRAIFDLPTEIIQAIVSLLHPSDAVSFSISNRRLMGIVGTCHIRYLVGTVTPWHRAFLQALERDIPCGVFCWTCNKIHIYARTVSAKELYDRVTQNRCTLTPTGPPLADREVPDYNRQIKDVYHEGFTFEHVVMVMKLRRNGESVKTRDYLKLLTLDRPKVQLLSPQPKIYGLYFFEPRIIDGLMVIRTQTWSRASWYQFPTRRQEPRPCNHINSWLYSRDEVNFRCSDSGPPDGYALNRVPWPQRNDLQYMRTMRCYSCKIEFSFHRRCFSRGGVKFFATCLTKWQILGQGTSPKDDWLRPLSTGNTCLRPGGKYTVVGSIARLFETQPGNKYDADVFDDQIWEELHAEDYQRRINEHKEDKEEAV